MAIALRIDVDTFRGTRDGLPRLLQLLEKRGIRGTWYMTLGPDNMGRHAWRLLKPAFALKMLRSGAPSLYGWDIVLRGTVWPGPKIGRRLVDTLRLPAKADHEVGVHAWDHHRWQMGAERLPDAVMNAELERAVQAFEQVYGREPVTAAAPEPCAMIGAAVLRRAMNARRASRQGELSRDMELLLRGVTEGEDV